MFVDGVLVPGQQLCWGMHTIARLKPDGTGFVCADPLSMGHIYRATTDELEIVANRADLAATAAGTYDDRDPEGLGWLLVLEYIVGTQTTFRRVRSLKAGLAVSIGRGEIEEVRIDGDVWRAPPPEYNDVIKVFADDLADHLATVSTLDRRVELSLTGGRDSRLVLALAVAAGVERSFGYMTAESFPGELDPDVEIASMLARELGLQHRVLRMNQKSMSSADYEMRVRMHAHTTSGLLGAKNLRPALTVRGHTQISGAFGENFTGPRRGEAPPSTVEDVHAFVTSLMYVGPDGGFLHREVREHYATLLRGMIDEFAADGTPVDELPYRFYVDCYLHGGIPREVEQPGITPNVEPLYSVYLPSTARAAGWYGRRSHRLHFDVMKQAAPRLAELPFASFAWSDELLAAEPDGDRYRSTPVSYSGEMRALRGRRWQDHAEVFRTHLLDGPDAIGELLDLTLVEDVLAGKRALPGGALRQLNNALGAAVWLSGGELPARVTAADVDRVHGAI